MACFKIIFFRTLRLCEKNIALQCYKKKEPHNTAPFF